MSLKSKKKNIIIDDIDNTNNINNVSTDKVKEIKSKNKQCIDIDCTITASFNYAGEKH